MSDSADDVTPPKFWSALGISATLHGAVGAVVVLRLAAVAVVPVTPPTAAIDFGTTPNGPGVKAPAPIDVEPLFVAPPSSEDTRAEAREPLPSEARLAVPAAEPSPRATDQKKAPRLETRESPVAAHVATDEDVASSVAEAHRGGPTRHDATSHTRTESLPNPSTPGATAVTAPRTEDATANREQVEAEQARATAPIDRASLHRAMAAATTGANSDTSNFTPPVIRVDANEKNLDRAFARAFAWAFAVDRSFFSEVPVGRARFVVELAEDGRIARLDWGDGQAPPRLKQLVARMAKLLSVNRFAAPMPGTVQPMRRAFALTVTQSRVAVPAQVSGADGHAGDIWMLAAGDPPTLGHPSQPSVADVTGRQINGKLEILPLAE